MSDEEAIPQRPKRKTRRNIAIIESSDDDDDDDANVSVASIDGMMEPPTHLPQTQLSTDTGSTRSSPRRNPPRKKPANNGVPQEFQLRKHPEFLSLSSLTQQQQQQQQQHTQPVKDVVLGSHVENLQHFHPAAAAAAANANITNAMEDVKMLQKQLGNRFETFNHPETTPQEAPARVSMSPPKKKTPPKRNKKAAAPVSSLEVIGAPENDQAPPSTMSSIASQRSEESQNRKRRGSSQESTEEAPKGGKRTRKKAKTTNTTPKSTQSSEGSATQSETSMAKTKDDTKKPVAGVEVRSSQTKKRKKEPSQTQESETKKNAKGKKKSKTETPNETKEACPAVKKAPNSTQKADASNPPTAAKKKKKLSLQDEVVLKMLLSCKPFTLKILAQTLKKRDSELTFLMLSLKDKGIIVKKEFVSKGGKTKELYWANQEVDPRHLRDLLPTRAELDKAHQETESLRREEGKLAKEYSIVIRDPPNSELDSKIAEAEKSVEEAAGNLSALKARIDESMKSAATSGKGKEAKTPAQIARERCPRRMKMRINSMRDEWRKRKEKCSDFIDLLADGMEKKPKDVIKILDVDTDEAEGVTMPPKHQFEQAKTAARGIRGRRQFG